MKAAIQKWRDRFEALSLRERGLVSLVTVVVLVFILDTVVMSPQQQRQTQLQGEMNRVSQQLTVLDQQIQQLSAGVNSNDGTTVKQQIQTIKKRLASLAQTQSALTVEFIKPKQMAKVLRDMLAGEPGLTLSRLQSLGVSPLLPPQQESEALKAISIYKHGMLIEFEGDYFSTLRYLRSLESMPWQFYWDSVQYRVLQYPKARVVITVHTLSLDEVWIGV